MQVWKTGIAALRGASRTASALEAAGWVVGPAGSRHPWPGFCIEC